MPLQGLATIQKTEQSRKEAETAKLILEESRRKLEEACQDLEKALAPSKNAPPKPDKEQIQSGDLQPPSPPPLSEGTPTDKPAQPSIITAKKEDGPEPQRMVDDPLPPQLNADPEILKLLEPEEAQKEAPEANNDTESDELTDVDLGADPTKNPKSPALGDKVKETGKDLLGKFKEKFK